MRTSRSRRGCRRTRSRTSRPYGGDCRRQVAQAEVAPVAPVAPMIVDVKLNKLKQLKSADGAGAQSGAARRKVELPEPPVKVDKAKLDKA